VNSEVGRMWKEQVPVVGCFTVLFQYLCGETEESHENP
jgi:hypothetical protein